MVMLNFNANEVEPASEFEPIPADKYVAIVTESEMKPNKAGTGHYLQLTFQIIEGPYKNRQLWARLNLDNPSDQAVKIAQGELSAICRSVGVLQPHDSSELHNIPLSISVKCKQREDNGEITNEISGYAKVSSASGEPQQATTNTPAWMRR
jgi:hypothetical protein